MSAIPLRTARVACYYYIQNKKRPALSGPC
ncbi:hypothetical protein FFRU_380010, partial [Fructobacillus fructosus]